MTTMPSRWIVRRGREGAWLYLVIDGRSVTWVQSAEDAERFAGKADALALAKLIAAGLDITVSILVLVPA